MRARVRQPLGPPFRQLGNGPCSSMETKPKYIAHQRNICRVHFFFVLKRSLSFRFVLSTWAICPLAKKKELGRFAKCVWLCDINPVQYYIEKQKEVVFILWDPGSSSMFIQHLSNDGNPLDFKLPRFFQKQSSSNNFAPTDWTYGTAAHRRYRRSKRGNHSRHGCPKPWS